MLSYIQVSSKSRNELIDITGRVEELVAKSGVTSGICFLFCLHTTAAITVNEGADPDVRRDIARFLSTLVPVDAPFAHGEGNSDSHVKSSLVGVSETLLIEGGRLLLGTWQSVYFCEFDGPRSRKVAVRIIADS
ncbi:MAG TPA: secondary thiamine-phosphate synthase enzyme YjbQ [Geobacteraceae bacterium]|nr:secondary thiamine-phosphate synthase enzyme YjbQ [Geobacteraceae bacterium]